MIQEEIKQASISVVMSIYKSENAHYFEECLESIWTAQTLKPKQIIIIQDGELPDSLLEVLKRWKNTLGDNMILHVNKDNIGLTKSLNIGIGYVTEKYIARMDSDDISTPDRFEKQYKYLEAHPDICALGSSAMEIDKDGKELFLRHYPKGEKAVKECICKATPLQHSAVMMRSDVFKSGLVAYDERYRLTQDLALWFDMLCAGLKIENLDDTLLKFRITESSFSRRNKVKSKNEFQIYVKGIFRLYGFTWRYVYPVARYIYRRMPKKVVSMLFQSRFRRRLLKQK
jgi:glycosyltransferase involved in cell wall biosynthesis